MGLRDSASHMLRCEAQGTQLSYADVMRLGDLSCCVRLEGLNCHTLRM